MAGNLQPLDSKFAIVGPDGRPTDYFTRWAQQRQIDINGSITAAQAQALINEWAAARQIIAGRTLDGGGFLSSDVTIDHAESLVVPGTYGDATHVPQFVVDQEGHIQGVVLVAISGGGGGSPWWLQPPTAASLTLVSGDATNLTLTDDTSAGLLIDSGVPASGDKVRGAIRTLTNKALDWELIIRLDAVLTTANFTYFGALMYDSVGAKSIGFKFDNSSTLNASRFNGLTSFNSASATNYVIMGGNLNWFRIKRVGANVTYYYGVDGKSWVAFATESVTAYLTNAPDKLGLFFGVNRVGAPNIAGSCPYFSLTGPAV